MKKRNIPLKNYLILIAITIITILLVFYLASWYNTSKEYYKNNSILSEYLPELRSEEINSYLLDNPEVVIYYASAKDEKIKDFEKEFKKLIENYEIKDDIIYVDSSKDENNTLISQINAISSQKIDSLTAPLLIHIKDGNLNKILYSNEGSLTKHNVRNFLIKNGIITND